MINDIRIFSNWSAWIFVFQRIYELVLNAQFNSWSLKVPRCFEADYSAEQASASGLSLLFSLTRLEFAYYSFTILIESKRNERRSITTIPSVYSTLIFARVRPERLHVRPHLLLGVHDKLTLVFAVTLAGLPATVWGSWKSFLHIPLSHSRRMFLAELDSEQDSSRARYLFWTRKITAKRVIHLRAFLAKFILPNHIRKRRFARF